MHGYLERLGQKDKFGLYEGILNAYYTETFWWALFLFNNLCSHNIAITRGLNKECFYININSYLYSTSLTRE